MASNQTIPNEFKSFFWDVDITELDLRQHQIFIIERLLNEGDQRTLRWVFETYTEDEIKEAVCISRGLSLKTARYWQYFFNLKEGEMRCFGTYSMMPGKIF
ncbi:hypothetical protein L1765_09820 [Microaerobacter geothermalis]|uniref:DUF6922 domain-containing protein n=1 Tax=Microaerobacter geothermalis TaxID=674972 RepID=UPI001F243237|nr:hypothetical protein [Microaerobacter geothermalis]MCF6094260.1 hypothetical protein [Microaerobacter geothermalis]